jgi:hypothetical protein
LQLAQAGAVGADERRRYGRTSTMSAAAAAVVTIAI